MILMVLAGKPPASISSISALPVERRSSLAAADSVIFGCLIAGSLIALHHCACWNSILSGRTPSSLVVSLRVVSLRSITALAGIRSCQAGNNFDHAMRLQRFGQKDIGACLTSAQHSMNCAEHDDTGLFSGRIGLNLRAKRQSVPAREQHLGDHDGRPFLQDDMTR